MTWKKVTEYKLEWQVRVNGGSYNSFRKKANQQSLALFCLLRGFSIMADMLRHELPRVWYEDAQKILKISDKEPTSEPS